LASPSWRSVTQHGPPGTAAAVVVEEASVVVVLVVVDAPEVEARRAEAA